MPSDFIIEYRERFLSYSNRTQVSLWRFETGRSASLDLSFQSADYSDLWTKEAIEQLDAVSEGAFLEIERREAQLLLGFAWTKRLSSALAELTREINSAEKSLKLSWKGHEHSLGDAWRLAIADEHPLDRAALSSRIAEKHREIEDLRIERLEKLRNWSQEPHLARGRLLRGFEPQSLTSAAQTLISNTQRVYREELSGVLPQRALRPVADSFVSDLEFALSTGDLDKHFPAWKLEPALRETFSGLGVLTYRQPALRTETPASGSPGVFPALVPGDVRLVLPLHPGVSNLENCLKKSVEAQRYLWASPNHPAPLNYLGDESTGEGFQYLFAGLLMEPAWLSETLKYRGSRILQKRLALRRAGAIRKIAAEAIFEAEFYSGMAIDLAEKRYHELLLEALGVAPYTGSFARSTSGDFKAAASLRAYVFEAQLREFVKLRFGSRWWTSRKAADFLIEIWNTGGRYSLDELSRLTDVGDLSFDWLADDLQKSLRD